MEYDDLEKIETLVHYLWDAAALVCLEQQPLRYTELARGMADWSGRHLIQTDLNRTRHRLIRMNLIEEQRNSRGHKVYAITAAGRARLSQIRALVGAVHTGSGADLSADETRKRPA